MKGKRKYIIWFSSICMLKDLHLKMILSTIGMTLWVWTWSTIQDVFMLCFVYAMTLIVIDINVRMHNNWSKVQCLGYNKTLHPRHWTLPQFIRCNIKEVIPILLQMTCKKEDVTKFKKKCMIHFNGNRAFKMKIENILKMF